MAVIVLSGSDQFPLHPPFHTPSEFQPAAATARDNSFIFRLKIGKPAGAPVRPAAAAPRFSYR